MSDEPEATTRPQPDGSGYFDIDLKEFYREFHVVREWQMPGKDGTSNVHAFYVGDRNELHWGVATGRGEPVRGMGTADCMSVEELLEEIEPHAHVTATTENAMRATVAALRRNEREPTQYSTKPHPDRTTMENRDRRLLVSCNCDGEFTALIRPLKVFDPILRNIRSLDELEVKVAELDDAFEIPPHIAKCLLEDQRIVRGQTQDVEKNPSLDASHGR